MKLYKDINFPNGSVGIGIFKDSTVLGSNFGLLINYNPLQKLRKRIRGDRVLESLALGNYTMSEINIDISKGEKITAIELGSLDTEKVIDSIREGKWRIFRASNQHKIINLIITGDLVVDDDSNYIDVVSRINLFY